MKIRRFYTGVCVVCGCTLMYEKGLAPVCEECLEKNHLKQGDIFKSLKEKGYL